MFLETIRELECTVKNLGEVSQSKITDGMEGLILIMKIRTSSDTKEHAFHANTSLKEL